jgi:ammonium transporter, Amt family
MMGSGFMIASTALVLMMTLPGVALFYSGMVSQTNVLGTMAQSFAATAIVSIFWVAAGYSLAFSGGDAWIGSFARSFMQGVTVDTISPFAKTIPEMLFMAYQMTFAVITCALVGGAVADRMKFSAFCLFCMLWLFVVYVPSAHWVWGGGFLGAIGVIDFAGGTVVHINAGIAGLTAAVMIGTGRGFGKRNAGRVDLLLAIVGAGLLWVGWFGFNGGSALSAGSRAVFAIVATHLAACAGAVVWSGIEWVQRGKPSVLGVISGAVAGLATITPASGFVLPWHGLVIGAVASAVCYWFCTVVKRYFKYDDSVDAFGVHGVGGIIGTLLAGVFATAALSAGPDAPNGIAGLLEGNPRQLGIQAIGVVVTIAWCAAGTWLTLKIISRVCKLRLSNKEEREGLDISQHGEALHQTTFPG